MNKTTRVGNPLTTPTTGEGRRWRKSSRSAGADNDCVELCLEGDQMLFRDSKLGSTGPVLAAPVFEIVAFKRRFAK